MYNTPVHHYMKAAKPVHGIDAVVHIVLIQTLLLLKCKSEHYHVK